MNQCHDLKEITTEEHDCFCCTTTYTAICSCGYKSIGSDKEFVTEEHKEHVKEVGRSITGGTWSATPYGRVMSNRVLVAWGCSTSDAKLIALAPEMMDIILTMGGRNLSCPTHTRLFGDSFDTFSASCMECRTIGEVQMLAKKLRAIGAGRTLY